MNPPSPEVLYCHCHHARVLPAAVQEAVLRDLCASGRSFEAVPDLCDLAARQDPVLKGLAARPLQIAACHPRAVIALFAAAGAPLNPAACTFLNLRTQPVAEILAALRTDAAPGAPVSRTASPAPAGSS